MILKIPIAMLLYLVWWAIHQEAEPAPEGGGGGDGGTKVRPQHRPPTGPRPSPRWRGPHREPQPAAPARVRTTVVRARDPEHS